MIYKILNIRTKIYFSDLPIDNLNLEITNIFQKSNLAFAGKFTDQNEFKVYDRWNNFTWEVPNFKRKTAYLKGKITETSKGSLLKLNSKPNPLLIYLPILCLLIGITTIFTALINTENQSTLIFGLITIATAPIFYIIGTLLRIRLQNNFKKYLNLKTS